MLLSKRSSDHRTWSIMRISFIVLFVFMKKTQTYAKQMKMSNQQWNEKLLANAIPVNNVLRKSSFHKDVIEPGYSKLSYLRELEEGEDEDNDDGNNFVMANYAFKYQKCATISTWSDELAEEEGTQTVLKHQNFILLRLYPKDKCDDKFRWGFGSQFGEYLIDMKSYLELRQEYEENTKGSYCQYCEECFADRRLDEAAVDDDGNVNGDDVNENGDDAAVDDVAAEAADDAGNVGDDAAQQEAEENGNDAQDDLMNYDDAAAAAGDDGNVATFCSKVCKNYEDKCADEDDSKSFDYEYFFGCERFEGVDGTQLYLGPHCADNGKILIGAFYDEECFQYASDIDVNSFTGYSFSSDGLVDYTSGDCISCRASDVLYYNQEDDNEDDLLNFCGEMYENSAQCNRRIDSIYQNENELKNEEMVCNYIENVAHKKYNEDGSIRLGSFHYSDVVYIVRAVHDTASEAQMKALTILVGLCAIFTMYATYLSRKIRNARKRGDLEWKESGIGDARSMSYSSDPYY